MVFPSPCGVELIPAKKLSVDDLQEFPSSRGGELVMDVSLDKKFELIEFPSPCGVS